MYFLSDVQRGTRPRGAQMAQRSPGRRDTLFTIAQTHARLRCVTLIVAASLA
jgi:hypothetical protein